MKTILSILFFFFAFANLLGQENTKTPNFEVSIHTKDEHFIMFDNPTEFYKEVSNYIITN